MGVITEWVTNIILFVLLATLMDMLLPNSQFQKYTKMVAGLLLIAIILTPILKFMTKDFEQTLAAASLFPANEEKKLEKSIEMQKKEIQASHDAYILEQMTVQLKKDAEEELKDQYGLEITNINILLNQNDQRAFPQNLQKVIVHVKDYKAEANAVEVVKKVEINLNEPLPPTTENQENTKKIITLLSKKWDVQAKSIQVQIEGGNNDYNG
ncbi:stage III sporulation protein AF [Bacillus sp. 03113]|uniref:stage III sporulation protein AF n=1 Tax=Bacillus sp. 03113 TaxID=2578211 RepID=UPI0011415C57|nr:stage III sporulation protein AF [Bacillus sp. 03113]